MLRQLRSVADKRSIRRQPVSYVFVLLAGSLFLGCAATGPFVAESSRDWQTRAPDSTARIETQVFLIGDAGDATLDPRLPALGLFQSQLSRADSNAVAVFLGDNLYCCGLSAPSSKRRKQDESRLLAQLRSLDEFPGRAIVVPGNHDWDNSGPDGLAAIQREELFVEAHLGYDAFLPTGGSPGPEEVRVSDSVVIIAIDTQWWLHKFERSAGDPGKDRADVNDDFILKLTKVIQRNKDALVIVVGHHPMKSRGPHAGVLPLVDHLFPLRQLHPALWIPLPIVGSLYPLGRRRYFGGRQDLGHTAYRSLIRHLDKAFSQHRNLIYAAGHEHSLQYFAPDEQGHHYIVSGAGSRPNPVGRKGATYAYAGPGHAVLNVYDNGSVWMEMWSPDGVGGTLVFRTPIGKVSSDQ